MIPRNPNIRSVHSTETGEILDIKSELTLTSYDWVEKVFPECLRSRSFQLDIFEKLKARYRTLPENTLGAPRMHEFILTLSDEDFENLKAMASQKIKLFLRLANYFWILVFMHRPLHSRSFRINDRTDRKLHAKRT